MNAKRKNDLRLMPTGSDATVAQPSWLQVLAASRRQEHGCVVFARRDAARTCRRDACATISERGFTLTELLVVLGTLAILVAMLLPALAATQPRSKAYQCLNNMRQLALAWTLYANENNERLALNNDPGSGQGYLFPSGNGSPSWTVGSLDWSSGTFNTNTDYLTNPKYSCLASYLNGNYEIFACPACAYYASPPQRSILHTDHRSRSVAMNAAVGDGHKYGMSVNNVSGTTPWSWSPWYVARKTTDLNNPGPSRTWVFTDQHPDSIDDLILYTAPFPTTTFTELPGNLHNGAAGVTFGDGHVEMHRWIGPVLPNRPVFYILDQQVPCTVTDPDMVWLAQHTPQPQ